MVKLGSFGLQILEVIGVGFQLVLHIGKGGTGTVYRVEDLEIGGQWALKVVIAEDQDSALAHEFRLRRKITDRRFIVDSQDPRRCHHRNLPLVLLPMELAQGTLRSWLNSSDDPKTRQVQGVEYFKQACSGCQSIFEAGFAHLDLKPENILLFNDTAKITDFGLGRYTGEQFQNNPGHLLQQGIGTAQYMSPEQCATARQKEVGTQSDIYSLGVILYEILDGSPPFDGTRQQLQEKHLNTKPPTLKEGLEVWWPVVNKCLQKNAKDRYPSPTELLRDIERLQLGSTMSVDVSCQNCGHINQDPKLSYCQSCNQSIESRFEPCSKCAKPVRLDLERCPLCGHNIGQDRLLAKHRSTYAAAKDARPNDALEALERIIQMGAAKDSEFEQVRTIRSKLATAGQIIENAVAATSKLDLASGQSLWGEVLEIFPRHELALEQRNYLHYAAASIAASKQSCNSLIELAKFEEAEKGLLEALQQYPTSIDLAQLLTSVRGNSREYTAATARCNSALEKRSLRDAQTAIDAALKLAPRGVRTQELSSQIQERQNAVEQLKNKATELIANAKFGEALEILQRRSEIDRDNQESLALQEQLPSLQKRYRTALAECRTASNLGHFSIARDSIEKALSICPTSQDAQALQRNLKNRESEKERALERRSIVFKVATACLLVTVPGAVLLADNLMSGLLATAASAVATLLHKDKQTGVFSLVKLFSLVGSDTEAGTLLFSCMLLMLSAVSLFSTWLWVLVVAALNLGTALFVD